MSQPTMKSWFILLLVFLLLSAATLAVAQEAVEPRVADKANETTEAPNAAGAMVLDALLLPAIGACGHGSGRRNVRCHPSFQSADPQCGRRRQSLGRQAGGIYVRAALGRGRTVKGVALPVKGC